jgi:hypothetical protein
MTAWHGLAGVGVVLGTAAALYGLHRLALWLEDHGWPYYRTRSPTVARPACGSGRSSWSSRA